MNLHKAIVTALAVLVFLCTSAGVFAEPQATYNVRNEKELLDVLEHGLKADDGQGGYVNWIAIYLEKDVGASDKRTFEIAQGKKVEIYMDNFNLIGTGQLHFKVVNKPWDNPSGDTRTHLIIHGSTVGFNEGLLLEGNIEVDYGGVYTSTSIDILGADREDHVAFHLIQRGDGWNSTTAAPYYIRDPRLPTDLQDLAHQGKRQQTVFTEIGYPLNASNGVIVVGGAGKAELNVSSGNWVRNAETIVGAHGGSTGVLNIGSARAWILERGNGSDGDFGSGSVYFADGSVRHWALPGTEFQTWNEANNNTPLRGWEILGRQDGITNDHTGRPGSLYDPRIGMHIDDVFFDHQLDTQSDGLVRSIFERVRTDSSGYITDVFQPIEWLNLGTLYIGYHGTGTVNIDDHSQVYVGSIGIGLTAANPNYQWPTNPLPHPSIPNDSAITEGDGVLNIVGVAGLENPWRVGENPKRTDNPWRGWTQDYVNGAYYDFDNAGNRTYDAKFDPNTTTVFVFGRDKENVLGYLDPENRAMESHGKGIINIIQGGHLHFDVRMTETGDRSGFDPKLTLGIGPSVVDNSWISGAMRDRDDGVYYPFLLKPYGRMHFNDDEYEYVPGSDEIVRLKNDHSQQYRVRIDPNYPDNPFLYHLTEEEYVWGPISDKDPTYLPPNTGIINGRVVNEAGDAFVFLENSLTFRNHSYLSGDLTIRMEENNFEDHTVISPGLFNYYHPYTAKNDQTFGQIVFDNAELNIGSPDDRTVLVEIDFSVRGDQNARSEFMNRDPRAYRFDKGRDVLYSNGEVNLYGTVLFRPQTGYYNDTLIEDDPMGGVRVSWLRLYEDSTEIGAGMGRVMNSVTGLPYEEGDTINPDDVHVVIGSGIATDDFVGRTFGHGLNSDGRRWFTNERLILAGDGPAAGEERLVIDRSHPGVIDISEQQLFLQMDRKADPFTDPATTQGIFNLQGVGGALEQIYNNNGDYEWLNVLDWLWYMNDDEFREAMHVLSGEIRASSLYMPVRSPWRIGFDRVNWSQDHNHLYFGTQNSKNPILSKNALWATSYYDYSHMQKGGTGYEAISRRVSFMSGYDRALWRNTVLPMFTQSAAGVVFGYTQPRLNQGPGRVIADDYLIGAHFSSRLYNRYEFKMWGGVGAQNYRIDRTFDRPTTWMHPNGLEHWLVDPDDPDGQNYIKQGDGVYAKSKLTGNTFTWSTEIAMPLKYQKNIQIRTRKGDEACTELDDRFRGIFTCVFRPYAAMDLSYVKQNSAIESGNYDKIILRYHQSDWTQVFGRVGLKTHFDWKRINFHTAVAYSHQLIGNVAPETTNQFFHIRMQDEFGEPTVTSPNFQVRGNYPGRSFFHFSMGTQVRFGKKDSSVAFLQYHGDYGGYSNSQTATLGYQFLF